MALTDDWAKLLAREVESTGALLSSVKNALVQLFPSVSEFSAVVDSLASELLSFYSPDLPESARKNSDLAMMKGSDVFFVISLYLLIVGLSLVVPKGSCDQKTDVRRNEKALLKKLGPVFIIQALYNISQVIVCTFLVVRVLDILRDEQYSFVCNRFNVPSTRMAEATWIFYMLKYFDLLDTTFMILRGNWRQLSFLHVYHHSSVIYISWVNASVGFEGDVYYVVALNSFVHVVMYAYYFMASLNIPLARTLKFFVTKLQMAQFLSMVAHAFYHIFFHSTCPYPVRVTVGYLIYVTSLYILFSNFSRKTYSSSDAKPKKPTKVKAY